MTEDADALLARYRRAIAGESLPLALIDLDALEANARRIAEPVARSGKTLRIATKSVRSLELLRRIQRACGDVARGVMAFSAREAALLAASGVDDVLLAYPTVAAADLARLAEACRAGARVAVVVDAPAHVDALARAAKDAGARLGAVIDVDVALRPLPGVHLGVRRSPLREPADVVALARAVASHAELELAGVIAYDAHVAGVSDAHPSARAMKALARPRVTRARAAVVSAMRDAGLAPRIVDGGGTGSVDESARDPSLTEIAAGSGFFAPRLFDDYRGLALRPAAFFALEVTRAPAPHIVTCRGGGWIASGAPGADRLPVPWLPRGLSLLALEGAGEVQTPLAVPADVHLAPGDAVFFRHAKSGELAEHVNEVLLVRGEKVEGRAVTYRGMGWAFG